MTGFFSKVLLFVLFLSAGPSQAAPVCQNIHLESGNQAAEVIELTGIQEWPRLRSRWLYDLEQSTSAKRREMDLVFESAFFFDYVHVKKFYLQSLQSGKALDLTEIIRTYSDRKFFYSDNFTGAFNSYLQVWSWLKAEMPALDFTVIKKINGGLLKEGLERVKEENKGQFRNVAIFGNASAESFAWTTARMAEFNRNIYAKVEYAGENWHGESQYRIIYSSLDSVAGEALTRLHEVNPKLAAKVEEHQKNPERISETDREFLERELVESLLQERWQNFLAEKSKLGKISEKNAEAYIDLVASFQRDFVSIHPFRDANGRTSRVVMNYLLLKEGLPPSRILDPNADLYSSLAQWQAMVRRGVRNSLDLKKDLLFRLHLNLPLGQSSVLLFPALSDRVSISQKQEKQYETESGWTTASLEKSQFAVFLKESLASRGEKAKDLQTLDQVSFWAQKFEEFQSRRRVEYQHGRIGTKVVSQSLVDLDFQNLFGKVTAAKVDQWRTKKQRWYGDELVWRGMSYRTKDFTDADMLAPFYRPVQQLVSNRVAAENPLRWRESIKEDFSRYNQELISGEYLKTAYDHSTAGPRYFNSYGLSTSKLENVAKAFAMGGMIEAPLGKHMTADVQGRIKSRINIASYAAMKDLDLTRVKVIDPEYHYRYGRQQEVMAIGAIEPDAVMIVQKLNDRGEVIVSFVRDPMSPNWIYKIKGRYVYSDGVIPSDRVLDRYTVSQLLNQ